jgi:iron complex outermembrane receptor protein
MNPTIPSRIFLCGAVFTLAGASFAVADEQTRLDSFDLSDLEVVSSADASAGGLTPPFAGGQVASGARVGLFGALDYMETPYAVIAYTQELIDNQQAASVGDVLLNDPGVRVARGFGNFQQLYFVRGLPVYSDDMSYNGLYGLLPRQYLATEFVERVEVMHGANAFLNGAAPGGSGLGGAVNVLPKRAPNESLTSLTAGLQTGGQTYFAGDLGRRYLDGRLGVRVNLANRNGETAVEGASDRVSVFGTGLDYRGERFRLSGDFGYQDLRRDGTQPSITIGAGLAIPEAPEAGLSVAQPWTFSNERDAFGTLRGEFDLTDSITAWLAGGAREGHEKNSFANPTAIDAAGTMSAYRFDNVREDMVYSGEVGLRGTLETGSIGHNWTIAAAGYEADSKNAYAFSNFAGFTTNLYAPSAVDAPSADFFVGGSMSEPLVTERTRTQSVAVADSLRLLDDQLIVLAGVRWQKIATASYNYNTGVEESTYDESALTPSVGLLYKVIPEVAVFANYIEGLQRGEIAPMTDGSGNAVVNGGEALSPFRTEQIEIGVKYEVGAIGGSVSFFQSEKPVTGLNTDKVYGTIGDNRYRGVDVSVFGRLADSLKILGGISFLDTDINGNHSIGAPKVQANLGIDWQVPTVEGLFFDGRVIATGSQYADAANTQKVSSWARLDLGARYLHTLDGGAELLFRARIENLTDEDYWASAGGFPGAGYLTVGAPRTIVVSTEYRF